MTIDTACSSSLVAVHHAVQQLRSGSSKVAVAAGANLIFSPSMNACSFVRPYIWLTSGSAVCLREQVKNAIADWQVENVGCSSRWLRQRRKRPRGTCLGGRTGADSCVCICRRVSALWYSKPSAKRYRTVTASNASSARPASTRMAALQASRCRTTKRRKPSSGRHTQKQVLILLRPRTAANTLKPMVSACFSTLVYLCVRPNHLSHVL